MNAVAVPVCALALVSCATSDESGYPQHNQRHPSGDLSDSFFPDTGMPTGGANNHEFFSKKCSPRSSSNHYSKTEYFCDNK
ncbi:MAG TPA: hypothetical protein VFV50_07675 [Bdellovibrionales bacterium]|nr:hypothetical protein [Bdellovibrionales bacterium]